MRAKFINEEDMPNAYKSPKKKNVGKNKFANAKTGLYPPWSGHRPRKFDPVKAAEALVCMLKIPYTGAVRTITDSINNHLEKSEGFHYGISKGFLELQNREDVTTEHGIPLAVQVKMMMKKINSGEIKSGEDMLQFIRDNYTICLLSPDENTRVNVEYNHSMPENWKEWIERYKSAEIELVQLPGNK